MKSLCKTLVVLGVVLSFIMVAGFVPTANAAKEIKIGVIYPLTGPAAAAGRELRAGAELAAKICNNVMPNVDMPMAKNAGIKALGGAKIKVIFKDHQGNPNWAPTWPRNRLRMTMWLVSWDVTTVL